MRQDNMKASVCEPQSKIVQRVELDAEKAEQGLVKLVLVVVELLRKLLERQAIRRIDSGRLPPEKVERLANTLMRLDAEMRGLQEHFGIKELDLDLGPLGRVIST